MCVWDSLLGLSGLVIDSKAAVCKSHCEYIAVAFGWGDPVVVSCKRVKLYELWGLGGDCIPSVNDIVIADAMIT